MTPRRLFTNIWLRLTALRDYIWIRRHFRTEFTRWLAFKITFRVNILGLGPVKLRKQNFFVPDPNIPSRVYTGDRR